MKIVIDIKYDNTFTATSKAREDVNRILEKEGFETKYINVKKGNDMKTLISNINPSYKQLKKILRELPDKSTLLFQYPFDSMSYKFSKIIKRVKEKKQIKTIALIHDLNSLRTASKIGNLYYKYFVKEIKFLDSFDKIICHNNKMKNYLVKNNISKNKIIPLGIFDYLIKNEKNNSKNTKDYKKVIIAGNLSKEKAAYVYQLPGLNISNYCVDLYGINYEEAKINNINYKGSFQPDKPLEKIKAGFGLIWDGSSCDKCDGNFGNYLRWNNPHKLSLAMACGIPVIVWKKSALSEFVEQNEIGISINSLRELDDFFKKLSIVDYERYCKNVSKINKKVINGKYLIDAIKKV